MNLVERMNLVITVFRGLLAGDTDELYEAIGSQKGLGDYLNQGWWDEESRRNVEPNDSFRMENQCQELVRRVGKLADLTERDRVLDVGFGLGEQDILWTEEFDLKSIHAINITHEQVRKAQAKISGTPKEETIQFLTGDATELPYQDNSFDIIIALESAFHFRTRENFFSEASRILKPDGRLVTADIIYNYPAGHGPLSQRIVGCVHDYFWLIPDENHITKSGYEELYMNHRFRNITIRDVTDNVLKPGITKYIKWQLKELPPLVQCLARPFCNAGIRFYDSGYLRYVLTRGFLRSD